MYHYNPQDEETAEAVNRYLDQNAQIKSILLAFNLEERLADEFLQARSQIAARSPNTYHVLDRTVLS